jgi:large subunit ribosomal protein L10
MASQKKKDSVKQVSGQLNDYSIIGILDMHKLPARQLHDIRNKLRGDATIRMVKKRLIKFIFDGADKKEIQKLTGYMQGEPALLLSRENPFKLARTINNSKSKAGAKAGDIAPYDIVVKAGPTSLPPGPAIGELQRIKIPAMVQGDKIHVRQDTVIAKAGTEISKEIADVLSKLGIEPMEIGLNLLAVWDNGTIYGKDILFIPTEKYADDVTHAHTRAFNLAFNIGYYTKDNVPLFLSKAHAEAMALAEEANIITKETVGGILAKGKAQAEELKKHVKEPAGES